MPLSTMQDQEEDDDWETKAETLQAPAGLANGANSKRIRCASVISHQDSCVQLLPVAELLHAFACSPDPLGCKTPVVCPLEQLLYSQDAMQAVSGMASCVWSSCYASRGAVSCGSLLVHCSMIHNLSV